MRLDIDDQVLIQLNNRCLFTIKFSRSVEFAASQSYLLNSIATRLNARPVYTRQSLKQTMQYKHLLCRTRYATAPLMQTPAPAAMPHLLCETPAMRSTCCEAPAANSRQEPLLSDRPTKMIEPRREIYRNLGRNSSLNFRHKPT